MTTTPEIRRRFEIHVAGPDVPLDDVKHELEAAVKKEGRGQVVSGVTSVERPPLLKVRLRGPAPAVFSVFDRVKGMDNARILRDRLEVPADAANGPVYPDARALLRMAAEPRPKLRRPEPGDRTQETRVIVAVVDSGIMVDHPDLSENIWKDEGGISDDDGHGTMVAGTILAAAEGNVWLMAAKFFDATTLPRPGNAAAAIDFAVGNEAKIICLSWDVGLGSRKLKEAIRKACGKALVVIAAGNNGSDNDRYPSVPASYARECPECEATAITVMATDRYNEKASFSNYGRKTVDLAAPGVDIVSTRRSLSRTPEGSRRYRSYSGTSAAAAHVAGAAALIMSRYPRLSPADIKRCLVGPRPNPGWRGGARWPGRSSAACCGWSPSSGDPLPDLKCAGGRVDVGKALECAKTLDSGRHCARVS